MKIIISKLLIIMTYLLGIFNTFAAPNPPPPNGKKPPPPPGLPIDDTLFLLLIIAVLFGVYSIYNYQLKTKTPS